MGEWFGNAALLFCNVFFVFMPRPVGLFFGERFFIFSESVFWVMKAKIKKRNGAPLQVP